MYALVQWTASKKITVLETSHIHGPKVEGGNVEVKYKGKPYAGIILRMSDKFYLPAIFQRAGNRKPMFELVYVIHRGPEQPYPSLCKVNKYLMASSSFINY